MDDMMKDFLYGILLQEETLCKEIIILLLLLYTV